MIAAALSTGSLAVVTSALVSTIGTNPETFDEWWMTVTTLQ